MQFLVGLQINEFRVPDYWVSIECTVVEKKRFGWITKDSGLQSGQIRWFWLYPYILMDIYFRVEKAIMSKVKEEVYWYNIIYILTTTTTDAML